MALAIWFSDDGSLLGSGFKIATSCFTKKELEKLIELLSKKYNLNCSLHKDRNYWSIYIKKSSAENFANLIKNYMLNSLKYKLGSYSH